MSDVQPPPAAADLLEHPPIAMPPSMAPVASPPASLQAAPPDRRARLLGVDVTDVTRRRAVALMHRMIDEYDGCSRLVYFVNAHTLNLAHVDPHYQGILNTAAYVFGDGTGVRWAARMKGVRLRDNLCGTDLVPELLQSRPSRRYFLLGADEATIRAAAAKAEGRFPDWTLVGFHHGFLDEPAIHDHAIEQIHRARPDVLLVGMGNPIQEKWLAAHRDRLHVPLCLGVGGLFDFWAERVSRAPGWLRRWGHEWIWRLAVQPRDKARRYLLGNPLFLGRAARDAWSPPA